MLSLNKLIMIILKKGQTLVEYALIIALIAIVCIVGLRALGVSSRTKINQISNNLTSA